MSAVEHLQEIQTNIYTFSDILEIKHVSAAEHIPEEANTMYNSVIFLE